MSKLLSLLAIVYVVLALWSYQSTPLGQEVLLDAKENWILAQSFLRGDNTTPAYRAPLYAGLLSVLMRFGLSDDVTLVVAQGVNVFFHLLSALFLGLSARLLWHRRSAGYLAGLLYALYPVALYLSFDLLDTALANCFGALGLYFLIRTKHRKGGFQADSFIAIVGFSLAALTRSHFLVWLGFGLFFLLRESAYRRMAWSSFGGGVLAVVLIIGGYVGLERMRTGQWGFLPTQAAYNLYAANQAGSSGESFVQKIEFVNLPVGMNPARAQAQYLYGQLNPDAKQKPSEAQINQYWRDAFWQELALNPNQKVSLYAKKLYAMFHLHEGYNNKTYAFQKSQNPFLAINPLNFLWVSALAFAGWLLIYPRPREAGYLLGLTLLYAASAAVFYASDRFRLPVVMPLCVLAGAATMIIPQLRGRLRASPFSAWRFLFWRCALIVSWVIVFSLPLWGVGQTETRGADYLLGAQASLNRGDSKQALKLAQSARKLQPQSQTAIQVALKAGYNSLIEGDITPDNLWVKHQLAQIDKIVPLPSSLRYMAGYYEWLLRGSRERWHDILAEATPGKLTSTQINALGAVIITNSLYPNEIALLQSLEPRPVILDVALAGVGEGSAMASLVQSLGQKEAQTTVESYRKLFDRQHFIGLNSKNAH